MITSRRPTERDRSLTVGVGTSTPVGVVAVWLLNHYVLPAPMPPEIAVAVGSFATGVAVWVSQWLPKRGR